MPIATLLKPGAAGIEVVELQSKLAAAGFLTGPADGHFGPATAGALGLGASPGPRPDSLLVQLGLIAEEQFGLSVHECDAPGAPSRWGPVHAGHAPNSMHFRGRAFDAGGPEEATDAFAAFVAQNHGTEVAQLIHNPNGSISNGAPVPSSFWPQATFDAHSHCHVAV